MVYGFTDIVIDSRTGLNPRKNFVLGDGENYYITIKDIYNGEVNFTDKSDKVNDEAIQIIKRRSRIKVGDILFVSIGRIGETAIVRSKDDSWDVNESVFVFTLNEEIITPEYFCMLFQSQNVKQYLSGNSSGSTFKSIKMNQLERMTFDLPTLAAQRSIAEKLAAVKRIIDGRTSQLLELDSLVKARFVEMFGDPVTNPRRLPIHQLGDHILFLTSGSRGWSQYFTDEGEYFITIKNVKDCCISLENVQYVLPPNNAEAIRTRVEEGDLLISITADLGRTGVVSKEIAKHGAYINQHLTCIRLDRTVLHPMYTAYYLESAAGKEQFSAKNQTGVKAGLNFNAINSLHLLIPPMPEQEAFVSFVEQTDKSKAVVQQALDEAQTLFDSLMQQYFG